MSDSSILLNFYENEPPTIILGGWCSNRKFWLRLKVSADGMHYEDSIKQATTFSSPEGSVVLDTNPGELYKAMCKAMEHPAHAPLTINETVRFLPPQSLKKTYYSPDVNCLDKKATASSGLRPEPIPVEDIHRVYGSNWEDAKIPRWAFCMHDCRVVQITHTPGNPGRAAVLPADMHGIGMDVPLSMLYRHPKVFGAPKLGVLDLVTLDPSKATMVRQVGTVGVYLGCYPGTASAMVLYPDTGIVEFYPGGTSYLALASEAYPDRTSSRCLKPISRDGGHHCGTDIGKGKDWSPEEATVATFSESNKPKTGEKRMEKISNIASSTLTANKNAAQLAGKVELGRIMLSRIKAALKQTPVFKSEGAASALDTPLGEFLVANALTAVQKAAAPGNDKAQFVAEAALEAAYVNGFASLNIDDLISKAIGGVDLSKYGFGSSTTAPAVQDDSASAK